MLQEIGIALEVRVPRIIGPRPPAAGAVLGGDAPERKGRGGNACWQPQEQLRLSQKEFRRYKRGYTKVYLENKRLRQKASREEELEKKCEELAKENEKLNQTAWQTLQAVTVQAGQCFWLGGRTIVTLLQATCSAQHRVDNAIKVAALRENEQMQEIAQKDETIQCLTEQAGRVHQEHLPHIRTPGSPPA